MPWRDLVEGASICITGGTGSFGVACAKRLLADAAPRRVILLSRNERRLDEAKRRLGGGPHHPMRYFVRDVRDFEGLCHAFRGVDLVLHAAAMKRVDTCEAETREAVLTNVLGSEYVMQAAIENGVRRVVYLSTDKAVAPDTTYGCTKLLAERLLLGEGNRKGAPAGTHFAATRYGNVLGSAGSVVEYWRAALASGAPFLIRGADVTRFWMTMEQAVTLVLETAALMRGGEVCVPKLGAATLSDLADALGGPEYPRTIEPIGATEKLHEQLVAELEMRRTRDMGACYLIEPPDRSWDSAEYGHRGVPGPREYRSDTCRRLTLDELRAMLGIGAEARKAA